MYKVPTHGDPRETSNVVQLVTIKHKITAIYHVSALLPAEECNTSKVLGNLNSFSTFEIEFVLKLL